MPGIDTYKANFETNAATLTGTGPDWLRGLRKRGMEAFLDQGFPTLRDEEWRFTRTRPIQERDFAHVAAYKPNGLSADQIAELTFKDAGCHRIVIVDGHFAPDLSAIGKLPTGVQLTNLADALEKTPEAVEPYLGKQVELDKHPFAALNSAFMTDGLFLKLDKNTVLEEPLHLVIASSTSSSAAHPRLVVVADEGAQASIVESHIGDGEYLNNVVSEFFCAENASLRHTKLQRQGKQSFHVSNQQSTLAGNSRFATENISIGAALVRNDVSSYLGGEGIDCRVDGLYLADERQHVDNHTFIRHAKPHCNSFELYKGILNGKSRGVFNGRIYVDQDAQKTDAKQSNNCMLLSDDARINTNPQLEIFADDVKCTHGATVGQLDDESVFYMRSRGIEKVHAQHILIYAFAAEVIERVDVPEVRDRLEVDLFWWLSKSFTM